MKYRLFSLFSILFFIFIFQQESQAKVQQNKIKSFCSNTSVHKKNSLVKKYKQDPFEFVDLFVSSSKRMSKIKSQNSLLKLSLDLPKIYIGSFQNYKSRVLGNQLISYIRTKYFGNLNNLFSTQSDYIKVKNYDLAPQSADMNTPLQFKQAVEKKCSSKEKKFLRCKRSLLVLETQMLPKFSCYSKDSYDAFSTKFYLSYSQKFGFKIVDIELSGKRLILDALLYTAELKSRGYNKSAALSQLSLFSNEKKNSFKYPKSVRHSGVLAKIKRRKVDRLPSSL